MAWRRSAAVLALLACAAVGAAACGERRPASFAPPVPEWAQPLAAKEQLEEAARLGKPVAFEEPTTGMRFVLIPGGTFTMGSPEGEEERDGDEGPQHEVTLSPYYLGVYEVTNAEYRAKEASHFSGTFLDSGTGFNGDRQPVILVSHEEAAAWARWLSERGRVKGYRLPSEAQWEHACRAGTRTPFWFGETISTAQANYNGSFAYGKGVEGEHREKTVTVGSLPPNRWGLFEVHGNVWEWCSDRWAKYGTEAVTDPEGPSTGAARVLRGGSRTDNPGRLRSATRIDCDPARRFDYVGFRVALPASAL